MVEREDNTMEYEERNYEPDEHGIVTSMVMNPDDEDFPAIAISHVKNTALYEVHFVNGGKKPAEFQGRWTTKRAAELQINKYKDRLKAEWKAKQDKADAKEELKKQRTVEKAQATRAKNKRLKMDELQRQRAEAKQG